MAIGHQDHGRVTMPVAAVLARAVHQALDLALGEVVPLDCQVYDAWRAFCGCRFHADKLCLRVADYLAYICFIEQSKRTMSANWNEGSIATPDDLVDQLVRDPSGSGRSESLTVRRTCRLQRAWPPVGGVNVERSMPMILASAVIDMTSSLPTATNTASWVARSPPDPKIPL